MGSRESGRRTWRGAGLASAVVEGVGRNIPTNSGQPLWHRANLYQRFIETLESATTLPAGGYLRASLYAVFPRYRLFISRALQALGKHIEIHLLFTNPCRYYWGDIKIHAYLAKLLTRQRRHQF